MPLAQRLASASKPVLATVVNQARVPSAVSARPRSTCSTCACSSSATAAVGSPRGIPRARAKSLPEPVGTMPRMPSCSAASPASSHTVPSPPQATTPRPSSKARTAAPRASSRSADTCTATSSDDVASASAARAMRLWACRRPAVGFTTAVQRIGREASHRIGCPSVPPELDPKRIPRHVAIVMDGNGRWAQRRGLKRTEGHEAGEVALFDVVEGALEIGVRWLTVYAFSTENWRRPIDEVRFLMYFNETLLLRRRDDLHQRGVRVRFIGRKGGRVPKRVLRQMSDAEALTVRNRRMTLTFALNYGGRAELVDATRAVGRQAAAARPYPERIAERGLVPPPHAPDLPA